MPARIIIAIAMYVLLASCSVQNKKNGTNDLLFRDEFDRLDTSKWLSEIAPEPNSNVYVKNGKLVLDTKGGVTVWFKEKLKGNVRIEFTRTVVMDTGVNDRLSDLNMFWMATDPGNKNVFTRNGVFENYDNLLLYYVGMGGNTNTTTRFRKYHGNGEKPVLQEWNDQPHLLEANKEYKIVIEVRGNNTSLTVNGTRFFSYDDPDILKEGYFAFRSTKSRQTIDNFKVYTIR